MKCEPDRYDIIIFRSTTTVAAAVMLFPSSVGTPGPGYHSKTLSGGGRNLTILGHNATLSLN